MGLPCAIWSEPMNSNICIFIKVVTTRVMIESTPTCFIRRSFRGTSTLVLQLSNFIDLIYPTLGVPVYTYIPGHRYTSM